MVPPDRNVEITARPCSLAPSWAASSRVVMGSPPTPSKPLRWSSFSASASTTTILLPRRQLGFSAPAGQPAIRHRDGVRSTNTYILDDRAFPELHRGALIWHPPCRFPPPDNSMGRLLWQ